MSHTALPSFLPGRDDESKRVTEDEPERGAQKGRSKIRALDNPTRVQLASRLCYAMFSSFFLFFVCLLRGEYVCLACQKAKKTENKKSPLKKRKMERLLHHKLAAHSERVTCSFVVVKRVGGSVSCCEEIVVDDNKSNDWAGRD